MTLFEKFGPYIVINIETIGDPEIPKGLLPVIPDKSTMKADGRLKDPQKIEESLNKVYAEAVHEAAEEIRRFSIYPLTSKIIAFAVAKQVDAQLPSLQVVSGSEDEILSLITETFKEAYTIFTYNGKAFDIPHISTAYLRHSGSIPYPHSRMIQRYNNVHHIDLYEVLSVNGVYKKGTLGDWCERFGIARPFGKGSQVSEWYEKGDIDSIKHHCSDNVNCTYLLADRIVEML